LVTSFRCATGIVLISASLSASSVASLASYAAALRCVPGRAGGVLRGERGGDVVDHDPGVGRVVPDVRGAGLLLRVAVAGADLHSTAGVDHLPRSRPS
jgi:hypothetical protein